jgi:PUA-domain protein
MSEVRHRQRLREKEVARLSVMLSETLGCPVELGGKPVDRGELGDFTVLLQGQKVVGIVINEKPFPSLRLLQELKPTRKYVEVDMGAVKFVVNGADVMKPGIVDCDKQILEGDTVFVREALHRKPIAVGIAIEPGEKLGNREKGKGVRTIHWVGDKIWDMW